MKRVLLTGMSGTGKSSVLGALAARGYVTLDVDDAGWIEQGPDGGWIWREEPVREFLGGVEGGTVFIAGCAENQVKFYPQLDHVVLLSAPAEVVVERLATRTTNPYGKRPDELAEVLANLEAVEPLLRRGADHEVVTTAPLEDVVSTVLRLVGEA